MNTASIIAYHLVVGMFVGEYTHTIELDDVMTYRDQAQCEAQAEHFVAANKGKSNLVRYTATCAPVETAYFTGRGGAESSTVAKGHTMHFIAARVELGNHPSESDTVVIRDIVDEAACQAAGEAIRAEVIETSGHNIKTLTTCLAP